MTQAAILAASGSPGTTTGFKNKIINGNMVISQRNGSSVFSSSSNGVYGGPDRWYNQNNTGGTKFSVQQVATACPGGQTNALLVTSTSAYTVASGDVIGVGQHIEGYNIADLNWGSFGGLTPKTATLSFWIYSSVTGTFGGSIAEGNAGTAFYPFTYSIPVANTWTYCTVTIPGPTIGTWQVNNGRGIQILFSLGTGSTYSGPANTWTTSAYYSATGATNFVSTNGATWYMTGCQFEVGTTATNFDFRSIGTELSLCQRYCYVISNANVTSQMVVASGFCYNSSNINLWTVLPVTPRIPPTGISATSVGGAFSNQPGANSNLSSLTFEGSGNTTLVTLSAAAPGAISGQPCNILANSGSGSFSITFTGMEL